MKKFYVYGTGAAGSELTRLFEKHGAENTSAAGKAARVILSMAGTQAEYRELVVAVDNFLKKKGNISALRKALKKIIYKNKENKE